MRSINVNLSSKASGRMTMVLTRPALSSQRKNNRLTSVQVMAKKGQKGRVGFIPGQGEMVRTEPPVPEVDPENAEFVVFIRAKNYMDEKMKVMMTASPWVPLTIVKGGQAANFLVKALENEWGRKLYSKTLLKNIGQAVYKDRSKIEAGLKQQYPYLQKVPSSSFEYAMKIRDRNNAKDWYKSEGLTIFPPESELQGTAIDELKSFFSMDNLSSMFKGSDSTAPGSTGAPKGL